MHTRAAVVSTLVFLATVAATASPQKEGGAITIEVVPLGDAPGGVVSRIIFRYELSHAATTPELAIQGSIAAAGVPPKTFRYPLRPNETNSLESIETLAPGEAEIEARLVATDESGVPLLIAKGKTTRRVEPVGKPHEAETSGGAQSIIAEGAGAENAGSLRILPPRRDLAPNLFRVDVEVKEPVTRVEFYVEGKKIFTRNAPPYRAELDLGAVPRRVEVRVVGYDKKGRYVDADAWIVNERESLLEIKITNTRTSDGIAHIRISLQNPQNVAIEKVELFADDRLLESWARPPYAVDLEAKSLTGVNFIRATARAAGNVEVTDILFLDGSRYAQAIEVNVVELPVSVVDARGSAVVDLRQDEFEISEDGTTRKISNFAFSDNLPLALGILVDHSGSMEARLDDAREAALRFVSQMVRERDRAFFGGFSWDATKISPLVSDVSTLRAHIDSMPEAEGATALYDAIVTGLYQFRGIEGRRALVVVTDGDDTASRIDYGAMLDYARVARVPLYFIGIGMSHIGGGARLKSLAAETGGVAYFVRKVEDLEAIYTQLEKELRTQYLLSYYGETSGKDDRRYRKIDVKVKRPNVRVRAPRGYTP